VSHLLKFRLSLMMFLEYFVPGATIPILSLYLSSRLHFEQSQVGWILAMPALAAFVAPFITSHIADRYIRSEHLLALCHFLGAGVMLVLSQQTTFRFFLSLFFVYGLLFTPTLGLTNAIALHHVKDARRDFGGLRMWGTAGWVVVAWLFGYFWLRGGAGSAERLSHALYMSALASCVLAVYALTLPRASIERTPRTSVLYWQALKVFAKPSLALLCFLTFINSMVHQFYYFGMSPFLSQSGFASEHIMPTMSIGQVSEVIVLAVLWACLAKLGVKKALIIGALAQAVRYLLFALGGPSALIITGVAFHGICYAFFFTTGYLYVDQHSTAETRAGAQQLFTIMISGFGVFGGALLSGRTGQWLAAAGTSHVNYHVFWLVPAALGFAVALALLLFFKEESPFTRDHER